MNAACRHWPVRISELHITYELQSMDASTSEAANLRTFLENDSIDRK